MPVTKVTETSMSFYKPD